MLTLINFLFPLLNELTNFYKIEYLLKNEASYEINNRSTRKGGIEEEFLDTLTGFSSLFVNRLK